MKNKNKKKELCAILAQGNDQGANFGFKKKKWNVTKDREVTSLEKGISDSTSTSDTTRVF